MENVNSSKTNLNKNEEININDEYNLYEKKQIFLDNENIKKGNDIFWIRDEDTVCVSKDRDNRTYYLEEIEDLPKSVQVGDVYEKIDGKYVFNKELTERVKNITLDTKI